MHRRYVLLLGLGQLLTWGLVYYAPAITVPPVTGVLGAPAAVVVGAFSLSLLLTGLASPFACRWIERVGGRTPMLTGLLLQVAGLVVMAAWPGLLAWYIGWAIAGLGMAGGLYDAAFATAGRALGAQARPTIVGITLIGGFAGTLGWPLGASLLPVLGWRGLLLTYAAILLLVCGPMYLALPRQVPPPPPPLPATASRPAGGGVLFMGVAGFFTLRGAVASIISIGAPTMITGLGLSRPTAILLVSLIGPAQVGLRVVQTLVGRGWSPATLAWTAAWTMPLSLLILALSAGQPFLLWAAALFVLFYGVSNGFLTIARGTLPLYLFGPEGYATRIGRIALPVTLAQAAAPMLAAPLITHGPASFAAYVLAALAALAGLCLLPMLGR